MRDKIIIAITATVCSSIIWWSYYAAELNKQNSIERQQQMVAAATKERNYAEMTAKQKEYTTARRKECYDIYEKEAKKFDNVSGQAYDPDKDECVIDYHGKNWKEWDSYFDALSASGVVDSNKFFSKRF